MSELAITRDANRIAIVGAVRTPAEREQLKDQVAAAIASNAANHPITPEVILDVTDAAYLDTAVLAALVILSRKCIDAGIKLALEGANPDLLEQLRVTHIDQVLVGHGSRITPAVA